MKKNLFVVTFAICILMTSFVFAGWFTGHVTKSVTVYTAAANDQTFNFGGKTYQIMNLGPHQGNTDSVKFSIEVKGGSESDWCEDYSEGTTCIASDVGLELEIVKIGKGFFRRNQITNLKLKVTEIERDVQTDCSRSNPCENGESCNLDVECESNYCKNKKCTALPNTWVCEEVGNQLKLTAKNPNNPRLAPKVYYKDATYCSDDKKYIRTQECIQGVSVDESVTKAYKSGDSTYCANGCIQIGSTEAKCKDSSSDAESAEEIIDEIETLLAQLKDLI